MDKIGKSSRGCSKSYKSNFHVKKKRAKPSSILLLYSSSQRGSIFSSPLAKPIKPQTKPVSSFCGK
jgi:hypothetical protein